MDNPKEISLEVSRGYRFWRDVLVTWEPTTLAVEGNPSWILTRRDLIIAHAQDGVKVVQGTPRVWSPELPPCPDEYSVIIGSIRMPSRFSRFLDEVLPRWMRGLYP